MGDIQPVLSLPPGYHVEIGMPDQQTLLEGFKYFQQAIAAESRNTGALATFNDNTIPLLRYGDLPCGSDRACNDLKLYLERSYQRKIDPETLILSAGATHGLFWLVSLIFNGRQAPADVYLEEPTYFCAIRLFRDAGMRLHLIPTTFRIGDKTEQFTRHVDFDALEHMLKKHNTSRESENVSNYKMYRGGMMYLIPEHHNPTGFLMSEQDERRYLSLATKYDCLIVCDDVYQFLNFPLNLQGDALLKADPKNDTVIDALKMPQPVCMFGQVAEGAAGDESAREHVVSNASFSKLLAPGLRVGWMEAPRSVVQHIYQSGVFYSGGCPNSATGGMLVSAITAPDASRMTFERHVKRYALKLAQRMEAIRQVLHERLHMDNGQKSKVDEICRQIRWTAPKGGFFFTIILPPPPLSRLQPTFVEKVLRPALVEAKVFVHHGTAFSAAPRDVEPAHTLRPTKPHDDQQEFDATYACSYLIRLSAAYIASHKEAREAAEILCQVLRRELEKALA